MAAHDVVVVSVGMLTAVGLSAAETAAAVRAGTARFTEIDIRDQRFQPFVVAEVPEEGLPGLAPGLEGIGLSAREIRMLRLAARPLAECLAALPPDEPPPPLFLALPETSTRRPLNPPAFLDWLGRQAGGVRLNAAASDGSMTGRAGGVIAIGRAAEAIRSGAVRFAVAGGVDTYRDLYVLGTLDAEKRVKSGINLDGFIPGEGAAFVLLASAAAATEAGLPALARVAAHAEGFEAGHLYSAEPYRGDGLAATLAALAVAGGLAVPVAEVYSSMNGESHWGKEWGVSFLRLRDRFLPDHGMHHPADCYGDPGAAAGPLLVGLAAHGIAGGYRRSPALVYGSSDRGARAALTLVAAQGG